MIRRGTILLILIALTIASIEPVAAQGPPNRAGLVVQYGDGRVETACVRFAEEATDGYTLLERAGLSVVAQTSSLGAAVCKIGPDGCDYPAEGCFCKRDGPRAIYWAFYVREGDAWRYSNLSASSVEVLDGAVHGWAWGLGDSGTGAQPPQLAIDAICGPVAPQATAPAPLATDSAAPPAQTRAPVPALPQTPAPTPAPPVADGSASYAAFGLIALLLAAGIGYAARRRR